MHVLVSTTPIAAHTFNASVFVRALVAQRVRVSWHAPTSFHRDIAALGADPIPVERAWDPDRNGHGIPMMGTLREVRRGYDHYIVGRTDGRVADVRQIIAERGVDVVLSDTLAYGAGLAAQEQGLRWATFGDGPLHDRDPDTPPFGSGLRYRTGAAYRLRNRVVHGLSDLVFARSARVLREARQALRLPPEDRGGVLAAGVSPDLHLHGGVPGLEYPRRLPMSEAVHFVGHLYRPPPGIDSPFPDLTGVQQRRPVIAVTQGSLRLDVAELIEPAIAALSDTDALVLVAAGSQDGASAVRAIPSGRARVLAASYVPYDALVRHADVFISNGGWTGVTTALAHGVPVLQVGRTEEKADIGRRIEWSRAGLSLRRRASARDIARALHRIRTDPQIAAGVRSLHTQFSALDAGGEGAALIRDLVR